MKVCIWNPMVNADMDGGSQGVGCLKPQKIIQFQIKFTISVWLFIGFYMLKCLSFHSLFVMESSEKTMEWDKTSKWLMTKTGKNIWCIIHIMSYTIYPVQFLWYYFRVQKQFSVFFLFFLLQVLYSIQLKSTLEKLFR